MRSNSRRQSGGSTVSTIIGLVVFAYAIFVGFQYVPQLIESRAVQSILNDMQQTQRTDPVDSLHATEAKVIRLLQINEMNDMAENLRISRSSGKFVVTFAYERELNLIYETRIIRYNKSVSL